MPLTHFHLTCVPSCLALRCCRHTDGMFGPTPPTCTVLHCVQDGNSYTAFADGRVGYETLPEELREFADASDAHYRPSIIYGTSLLLTAPRPGPDNLRELLGGSVSVCGARIYLQSVSLIRREPTAGHRLPRQPRQPKPREWAAGRGAGIARGTPHQHSRWRLSASRRPHLQPSAGAAPSVDG
jgi:hypothetical protein